MQTLLIYLLLSTAAGDAAVAQRVYVLGSSINLREQPFKDAGTLEKLQIGTECLVTGSPQGEWLKVRCGEKEGYAAASLLGTEKPSVEKLRAEARDPKRKLDQREDSALRAATLSPDDVDLQKELGGLFFERNFDFIARLKKPTMKRTFTHPCGWDDAVTCLRHASSFDLKDVKVRAETKKNLFVVALGNGENITVYRGKYRLDKKTRVLTGEALEQVSFSASPVMEKALFAGIEKHRSDKWSLSSGQFILDESSQAILDGLPKVWGLMLPAADGIVEMQWNDCWKRPYQLQFLPDIHGRWRITIEKIGADGPEVHWISAVSKKGSDLELTLEGVYGGTTHEVLVRPADEEDIAYLRNTAYSFNIRRHPEKHIGCSEGGP